MKNEKWCERLGVVISGEIDNMLPRYLLARVAQWIEQKPSKLKVVGSIPTAGTIRLALARSWSSTLVIHDESNVLSE